MLGQKKLLTRLKAQIDNKTLPRFCIIEGASGSGKHTLVNTIIKYLDVTSLVFDTKIDAIREMIETSYTQTSEIIYIIYNIDNLSIGAMNALLKITEEPPNKAHFIFTCCSTSSILTTIVSRATIYTMDAYSKDELITYMESKDLSKVDINNLLNIVSTPGDINAIISYNVSNFLSYVDLVINNINIVSGANAFKISEKLALKDEVDKYDISLFLKAFSNKCLMLYLTHDERSAKLLDGCLISSKYSHDLRLKGVNKTMLIDMWILDIRKAWM